MNKNAGFFGCLRSFAVESMLGGIPGIRSLSPPWIRVLDPVFRHKNLRDAIAVGVKSGEFRAVCGIGRMLELAGFVGRGGLDYTVHGSRGSIRVRTGDIQHVLRAGAQGAISN